MKHNKNYIILTKIISYCKDAQDTVERAGDFDTLSNDTLYKNAASMCILQIGELVSVLDKEVIEKHNNIPWSHIKKMRNKAAHHYGKFDSKILWETIKDDIPILINVCNNIIKELDEMNSDNV